MVLFLAGDLSVDYCIGLPTAGVTTGALLHARPQRLGAADEALLAMADPGPDCRVVIMGLGALELTCALLQRGYTQVTIARPCDRAPGGQADIVVIPQVASAEAMARSIACARHMLAPLGTIAIRLAMAGAGPSPRDAIAQMRLHGFTAVRTRTLFGTALIRGELPLFGQLKCA